MRQRKPRNDLTGFENDHCIALRSEKPCVWIVKCKHCGKEHEQVSRQIQNNAKSRQCETFKPSNYSGIEKDDAWIRRRYGITKSQYEELLIQQNGGCAFCGRKEEPDSRRLAIDHCHATGIVRGILCNKCNNGLGSFGDNIEGMKKAIKYLINPPYNANAR